MIVLVTGGAGFIGSHVVDRLAAEGHEPRIFDLVRSPYVNGEVECLVGDLLDREALERAMRGCDAVAHLAAVADVNDVVADPARADLVNVRGTQLALEAALAQGVGRFVYASTVWVYGGANGNGRPLDEDTPLALPTHFYTATKLAGEMYCRSYAELYGLRQTTLRFGIPYGPRSRRAAVVAAFVARARLGEPLLVTGDGRQSRQFVYVEDLADGVVAALGSSAPAGTYNLVGAEGVSVRAIAETVCELVADVPILHVDGRRADVQMRYASGERAARDLDWRATTSFASGMRRYVDWVTETSGSP
ncbi:MAG: epimerase, partial [Candidatus Rokuibacteriota bacterium]